MIKKKLCYSLMENGFLAVECGERMLKVEEVFFWSE